MNLRKTWDFAWDRLYARPTFLLVGVDLQNKTNKYAPKEDIGEENISFVEVIQISARCRLVEEESQAGRQERAKS